jgi:CheY-like chemotaxis protein
MTSKGTILLIEDDPDTRFVFSKLLEMEGFEVASAGSGNEALELLGSGIKPFVVLLDLMMPGMNGPEFRDQQAKLETFREIPVILTSGRDDIAERAREMKVFGHLRKPYSIDDLLKVIRPLAK